MTQQFDALQGQLHALREEARSREARVLALECAVQCLIAHWGQPRQTLGALLDRTSRQWDSNYERWEEPKPDQDEWHSAFDSLQEVLTKGTDPA